MAARSHCVTGCRTVADCRTCRKRRGGRTARESGLGQAMSYRFKNDRRGRRVFAATSMKATTLTDRGLGAVGVDLNADHPAVARVVEYTRQAGKPLIMERLDLQRNRAAPEGEPPGRGRMLPSFCCCKMKAYILLRGYREGWKSRRSTRSTVR